MKVEIDFPGNKVSKYPYIARSSLGTVAIFLGDRSAVLLRDPYTVREPQYITTLIESQFERMVGSITLSND